MEPTKIPMTTHKRRPKIEVGFESSEFKNAASYTDIVGIEERERGGLVNLGGIKRWKWAFGMSAAKTRRKNGVFRRLVMAVRKKRGKR